MLLSRFFERFVQVGTLTVIDARGRRRTYGDGAPPVSAIRLRDKRLHYQFIFNAYLHVGEAYMDGTMTIEEGTLHDFFELVGHNLALSPTLPFHKALNTVNDWTARFHQYNPVSRTRKKVVDHYDLCDELFDLFLDPERQYSCAYFTEPGQSLEQAQLNKLNLVAAKLMLEPGMRVLDMGCGWGSLARFLARREDVTVTGVTLSEKQLAYARWETARAGLGNRVDFLLKDYRELVGSYDRIVSVGMFEHVGKAHYPEFFAQVETLLTPEGVALLHSIGRKGLPGDTTPWIRKYIFPGGYSPALSEVFEAIQKTDLWPTDLEILRLHYAETLRAWSDRFRANRARVARLYDERFCRMWEFYLETSEMSFRWLDQMVFQMQLTRQRDAVPLTRSHLLGELASTAKVKLTDAA